MMSATQAHKRSLPPVLMLRSVRLHLVACGVGCIVAAVLAIGANHHAGMAIAELQRLRAERDAARSPLTEPGSSQVAVRVARFRDLALRGAGTDAVALADALLAAAAALRLPSPSFEIEPRQPLQTDEVNGVHSQVMRFAVKGLHEEDLLRLLQALDDAVPGSMRVEDCRLQRAANETALAAECTVRWLVWPRAKAGGDGA